MLASAAAGRPPVRTYGRRGAAAQKRRAPSPEPDSPGQDVDGGGEDTPRAKGGALVSARSSVESVSGESAKRSRTDPFSRGETTHTLGASSSSQSIRQTGSHANGSSSKSQPTTPKKRSLQNRHGDPLPSPRDLSDLFLAVSPVQSPSGKSTPPKPRARRMLSKAQSMNMSQTEPSTPRPLRTAQSMPITPSSSHTVRSALTEAAGSVTDSPSRSTLIAAGPPSPSPTSKRTYGGSRSFLTRNAEAADDDEGMRESYEEQRKRYEVDAGDVDPLLARAPEPIADMRSKGENRRFMGEIGFLVDGIQGSTAGARRSRLVFFDSTDVCALELVTNMLDTEWAGKLNLSGQTERIFEVLLDAGADDYIMNSLALLYLCILAQAQQGIYVVLDVHAEGVARLLVNNLNVRNGPLDPEYKGKVTPIINSMCKVCREVITVSSTRRLTSMALALCLCRLPPLLTSHLLDAQVDMALISSVVQETKPLIARQDLYMKGLDLLPPDDEVDLQHVEHCLHTLTMLLSDAKSTWEGEGIDYFDDLVGMFVVLMGASEDEDETLRHEAVRCTVQSLQPLVALASSARRSSHLPSSAAMLGRLIMSRDTIVKSLRDSSAVLPLDSSKVSGPDIAVDDLMSFALAILVSMIDTPAASTAIATTCVSSCAKRACINGCQCPTGQPLACVLAALYSDDSAARGDNDLTQIYLHGYLAYIIARLLVTSTTEVRPLVESSLPGQDWGQKVSLLHDALLELRNTNASTTNHRQADETVIVTSGESTNALLETAMEQLLALK